MKITVKTQTAVFGFNGRDEISYDTKFLASDAARHIALACADRIPFDITNEAGELIGGGSGMGYDAFWQKTEIFSPGTIASATLRAITDRAVQNKTHPLGSVYATDAP